MALEVGRRLGAFQKFLEKWKVLFETASIFGLGLAGIFLAFQANRIANVQTELAQLQLRQENDLEKPFIQIRSGWQNSGPDNWFRAVSIINQGGDARRFESWQLSFVKLTRARSDLEETKYLPWYLFYPRWSGDAKGTLVEYSGQLPAGGTNNTSEVKSLLGQQGYESEGYTYYYELCVFFLVRYEDVYGDKYDRVFLWDPDGFSGPEQQLELNSIHADLLFNGFHSGSPVLRTVGLDPPQLAEYFSSVEGPQILSTGEGLCVPSSFHLSENG